MNKVSLFVQKTPLHIAVEKENLEIIKLLLQHKGIHPDEKDNIMILF